MAREACRRRYRDSYYVDLVDLTIDFGGRGGNSSSSEVNLYQCEWSSSAYKTNGVQNVFVDGEVRCTSPVRITILHCLDFRRCWNVRFVSLKFKKNVTRFGSKRVVVLNPSEWLQPLRGGRDQLNPR